VKARLARVADRLPPWAGSIRFRLTALYSLLLFGLAALVVAGLYTGLARTLDDQPVSQTYVVRKPVLTPEGVRIQEDTFRGEFRTLEQLVNERALHQLRSYSFAALGVLFLASLAVGWFVAGRVLRPIGHITDVAREIQGSDLSRRIAMQGPRDELRDLADTFDAMLARIDEAFEGQRRFIQEASHELRNPLAVMRTNIDVALADPDASADDLRRTAAVVGRTAERMSRLVDDLLLYARRGMPERHHENVDLAGITQEIADEFALPAERRHVELVRRPGIGPTVSGDRTGLKQAAANLVDNAVRLAPSGTRVEIATGTEGGWAWLSVSDQGPGIAADDQARVFERFVRADVPGGSDDRRSGLGLTIVRQIAEAHGGEVRVSSALGAGSTFTIFLPPTSL
jgi:signal transduction histidine kinase